MHTLSCAPSTTTQACAGCLLRNVRAAQVVHHATQGPAFVVNMQIDSLSSALGRDIVGQILQSIPPAIRSFASTTCKSWYYLLKDLRDYERTPTFEQAKQAARYGYLDYLKYLIASGYQPTTNTLVAAADNLDCLKYLHGIGCKWDARVCASASANIECLKYAHEMGCEWNSDTFMLATAYGKIELLIYAHEMGCEWNSRAYEMAIIMDHMEVVKYLHENRCPWDKDTSALASSKNSSMLKYLHENGCPWDSQVCSGAALAKRLDNLKYAHENGCKWDSRTCTGAASTGSLACLQYAHENLCRWYDTTCLAALNSGNLDCLKYAHENGACARHKDIDDQLGYSDQENFLLCMEYVLKNKCIKHASTCTTAVSMENLSCLVYAHENGWPWDVTATKTALQSGRVECLKYLIDNGCEFNKEIMAEGLVNLQQQIEYLKAYRPWEQNKTRSETLLRYAECCTYVEQILKTIE